MDNDTNNPSNDDTDKDESIESIANDIVSQLKNTLATGKQTSESELQLIDKNQIDQFIVDKTSSLIDQTMYVVNNLKDYVAVGGADSKEVLAFAEVVKATSSALEALNKIHATAEKSKTAIQLKTMDIQARKEIASQDNTTKLLLGREELMKQLIQNSEKIVDI